MADDTDNFWGAMASKLRRALNLHPLCDDEAEKEYKAAPTESLPAEKLDAMMESIVSGRDDWEPSELGHGDGLESGIDEESLQLNRNPGDADPEVDDLVERHRRKALGKVGEDDKNQTGMADGEEPPREGR